jgi:hypothetical protein
MEGVQRCLYKLPELTEALKKKPGRWVLLVEGEKDADLAWANQFVATTNPGGALKWLPDYNESLRGCNVAIIPDNDPVDSTTGFSPGKRHAEEIKKALTGIAQQVVILELPELPPKGDFTDWWLALDKKGISKLEDRKAEFNNLLKRAIDAKQQDKPVEFAGSGTGAIGNPVGQGQQKTGSDQSAVSNVQQPPNETKEPEIKLHPANEKVKDSEQFDQAREIMHVVQQIKEMRNRKHPPIPTLFDLLGRIDTRLTALKTTALNNNSTVLYQCRELVITIAALCMMALEDVPGLDSPDKN